MDERVGVDALKRDRRFKDLLALAPTASAPATTRMGRSRFPAIRE